MSDQMGRVTHQEMSDQMGRVTHQEMSDQMGRVTGEGDSPGDAKRHQQCRYLSVLLLVIVFDASCAVGCRA